MFRKIFLIIFMVTIFIGTSVKHSFSSESLISNKKILSLLPLKNRDNFNNFPIDIKKEIKKFVNHGKNKGLDASGLKGLIYSLVEYYQELSYIEKQNLTNRTISPEKETIYLYFLGIGIEEYLPDLKPRFSRPNLNFVKSDGGKKNSSSMRCSIDFPYKLEYVVGKGDTIRRISRFFDIPVSQIKSSIGKGQLKVGKTLKLCLTQPYQKISPIRINKGDSLGKIAMQLEGINARDLADLNGIRRVSDIHAGMILKRIYAIQTNNPSQCIFKRRTVKYGETLSHIAQEYDMSISSLKKINHMNSNQIQSGKRLKVCYKKQQLISQVILYQDMQKDTMQPFHN